VNGVDPLAPRAAGGPVSAGKMYLVGEKGPELFSPTTSGMIIPRASPGGGASPFGDKSGPQRVIVELRSEMLDATIAEGANVQIARAYPVIRAGVQSAEAQRRRRA
jgi:hypothetical protein